MEVASMLAGEQFTDEPRCVCPVIGEFMRTYNDIVDNTRRQDLLAYAALVVDTNDGPAGERRRAGICLDWWLATSGERRLRLRRLLWKLPPRFAAHDVEIAHRSARWAAASPDRHVAALQLIEAMSGRKPLVVEPGLVVSGSPDGQGEGEPAVPVA
jgi:hypothetical protein